MNRVPFWSMISEPGRDRSASSTDGEAPGSGDTAGNHHA